jgi:hypothetical protein
MMMIWNPEWAGNTAVAAKPDSVLAMLSRSSCKFIFWFCDTVYKNVRGSVTASYKHQCMETCVCPVG